MKGFLTADAAGHKQLVGKIMSVVDEGIATLVKGSDGTFDYIKERCP